MKEKSSHSDMAPRRELLVALLPQLPLVFQVVAMHLLGTSEASRYLDLRAQLVVTILRATLDSKKPRSVSQVQRLSMASRSVKGRIWVSQYAAPVPPETSVRDVLLDVIEAMDPRNGDGNGSAGTEAREEWTAEGGLLDLQPVEAEWTGYRAGVSPLQDPPPISEAAKYQAMMKECRSPTNPNPTTVLYFHGGAYYLMDPATHRPTTKRLAKMLGGRCYSVRYRLAPKHPFPCALLDALVSYLTLLYPPPGAFHEPVKPEHILFCGDSAGGNLCLALLQVLLHLNRRQPQHQPFLIPFHGTPRPVPLPAAIATLSPWADLTLSAPAWQADSGPIPFDYLPRPRPGGLSALPPCALWPADPPRENLYAADALLAHPLVSVLMAQDWTGAPPVYMSTGWEYLAWEDKALARKMAADGVRIVFEEFEAMPHCFALVLTRTPSARRCFASLAAFAAAALDNPGGNTAGEEQGQVQVTACARTVRARTGEAVELRFEELLEESHEEVRARVAAQARKLASCS